MPDFNHLNEWNRIENEETIHSIASASFISILSRVPVIESYATWQLAAVGATAGLCINSAESLIKMIGAQGFSRALFLLGWSALFGLAAKAVAVLFPSDGKGPRELRQDLLAILEKHSGEREKILANAVQVGAPPPPDISSKDFIEEILKPFPKVSKCLILFILNRSKGNERNRDLHIGMRGFFFITAFCLLQSLSFIGFIVAVAAHAYPRI